MAEFKTQIIHSKDLTLHTVSGLVGHSELISNAKKYYAAGNLTSMVLWDFRNANINGLHANQLREIAWDLRDYMRLRAGGKTAFVVSDDIAFGIARMFEAFAESECVAVEQRTFRDIEDAIIWLLAPILITEYCRK
jgi:hypothetical protein